MRILVYLVGCLLHRYVNSEIRSSVIMNKLMKVKTVGNNIEHVFMPLTEIPPPRIHMGHGRRHMEDECTKGPTWDDVHNGPRIELIGDYYDEDLGKTVATMIIPDHIDYKHFQVTTQVPYISVGTIEAIGYHPSTIKGEHPSECEKIYQDHLEEQYSEESADYSEESMEMARMPLIPAGGPTQSDEKRLENIYSDME